MRAPGGAANGSAAQAGRVSITPPSPSSRLLLPPRLRGWAVRCSLLSSACQRHSVLLTGVASRLPLPPAERRTLLVDARPPGAWGG